MERAQCGTGAGKDNGVLQQPLQCGRLIEIKVLVKAGLWARCCDRTYWRRHGDKRVAIGVRRTVISSLSPPTTRPAELQQIRWQVSPSG